jgi:hypothetical protein
MPEVLFTVVAKKIIPGCKARQVEQYTRNAVGANVCNIVEHKNEHKGGKQWLQYKPQRAQYGLFVLRNKIALNKHIYQVAVTPQFAKLKVQPFFAGFNYQCPIVIFCPGMAHTLNLNMRFVTKIVQKMEYGRLIYINFHFLRAASNSSWV